MAVKTMKERLREIIEELPEPQLETALRVLELLRDGGDDAILAVLLTAPLDDEEETPEEATGVKEAYEDIREGRVLSHRDAKERLRRRE